MVHIIQSDPEVPVGIVGEELQRRGVEQVVVRVFADDAVPDPAAVKAVIALGGAMGANDDRRYPFLTELKRFLGKLARLDAPFLGICLGGQLLSVAMDGVVTSNSNGEKGMCAIALTEAGRCDRLFAGLEGVFPTFQWHNDSFSIPPGAIRLAMSDGCPNQAFRIGQRVWGVQFHPEVDVRIVRDWSSWTPETAAMTEEFVAAYRERETEYGVVSRRLVANFLEIAGLTT